MIPIGNGATRQLARHVLVLTYAGVPRADRPALDKVADFVRVRLAAPLGKSDANLLLDLAAEKDLAAVSASRQQRLLTIFGLPEIEHRWQHLRSRPARH